MNTLCFKVFWPFFFFFDSCVQPCALRWRRRFDHAGLGYTRILHLRSPRAGKGKSRRSREWLSYSWIPRLSQTHSGDTQHSCGEASCSAKSASRRIILPQHALEPRWTRPNRFEQYLLCLLLLYSSQRRNFQLLLSALPSVHISLRKCQGPHASFKRRKLSIGGPCASTQLPPFGDADGE